MKYKILLVIAILIHVIILTQSLLPANLSADQSGFIVDVLHPFMLRLGIHIEVDIFSFIIRKLAHFTEFFFLGIFWYCIYTKYHTSIKLISVTLLHGLITAILDETVQLFVYGRSGEFRDVLIDFSGVMLAVLCMHLVSSKMNKHTISKPQ